MNYNPENKSRGDEEIFLQNNWTAVYVNCDAIASSGKLVLDDATELEKIISQTREKFGITILKIYSHQFEPQGASALALIAESHMAIHTYPERLKSATAEISCCNPKIRGEEIVDYLAQQLNAEYGWYSHHRLSNNEGVTCLEDNINRRWR